MATGGPDETEDALGAMGLKLENAPDNDCDVWPENWLPVHCFISLGTQWRIAPNGRAYGLDYAAIPTVLRLNGVARAEWQDVFQSIQVMEAAYLETIK